MGKDILTVYSEYTMTFREKTLYSMGAAVLIFLLAFVFYRNYLISLLFCPLSILYPEIKRKEIIKKRKTELNIQFKDMLYSVSSSLSASKSIEMAIRDTVKDLEIIYPDHDVDIIKELKWIISGIEMNQPIETLLQDFAKRSDIEDIYNFSNVISLCKRTGGNLIEVIKNTSNIINDKIEIRQEIGIILAQRKFEQRILNVLPIIIVLLLSVSAEDYVKPIFNTMSGRIVMTISLALFITAFYISKKISDIKV